MESAHRMAPTLPPPMLPSPWSWGCPSHRNVNRFVGVVFEWDRARAVEVVAEGAGWRAVNDPGGVSAWYRPPQVVAWRPIDTTPTAEQAEAAASFVRDEGMEQNIPEPRPLGSWSIGKDGTPVWSPGGTLSRSNEIKPKRCAELHIIDHSGNEHVWTVRHESELQLTCPGNHVVRDGERILAAFPSTYAVLLHEDPLDPELTEVCTELARETPCHADQSVFSQQEVLDFRLRACQAEAELEMLRDGQDLFVSHRLAQEASRILDSVTPDSSWCNKALYLTNELQKLAEGGAD